MDRNQIIGLVLMMVMITVYFTVFAPETPEETEETQSTEQVVEQPADSTREVASTADQPRQMTDSALLRLNEMKYGLFSQAASGSESFSELANSDIKVTFSSVGATVDQVELLNYEKYDGDPVVLVTGDDSKQHLYLEHLGKEIDLQELYFNASRSSRADTTLLTYTLNLNANASIKYEYSLPPSGFQVGLQISTKGLKDLIGESIGFTWEQKYQRLELDIQDARTRSTVRYSTVGEDVDFLTRRSTSLEEEIIEEPVRWMAFQQKFFTSAIIADDQFKNGTIQTIVDESDSTTIKKGTMIAEVPYEQFLVGNLGFTYYFGPNDFDIMKEVAPRFEKNVYMGINFFSGINRHFIRHVFNFLEGFIGNYGIIIMIMVIFIRILLSPLTYRSHMSMAKMRVLKPELDAIKEKHDGDMQKAQQEQMDLYRKVGINPLAGCIPMILQMPILFSLFYFFPNAIELRQESFLWSSDLSTYDNVLDLPFTIPMYGDHVSLFTLLMTVSTILYTWSQSQITTVQGPMKTMQYLMPVMFLFFLNSFSSGLTFYYFVSNMTTFGQTYLFRRFIDDSKILSALEENKKKNANKKKSKFQARLEEAMKANQEAQKKKKKK